MFETALADILAAKTRRGCGFARWFSTLEDDDQARLDEMLRHDDVTAIEIVEAVAPHYSISATTLRKHRRSVREGSASGCGCR